MDNVTGTSNSAKKMMEGKFLWIVVAVVLVVLLIGVGVFFYMRSRGSGPITSSQPLPTEVVVQLTEDGFSPETVTIAPGSAVRWVNETDEEATVNSDNYPDNQLYKPLNLGVFSPGSSLVLIFDEAGEYTYHDQFNPDRTGTVVVE